jgi:hypothetical protein
VTGQDINHGHTWASRQIDARSIHHTNAVSARRLDDNLVVVCGQLEWLAKTNHRTKHLTSAIARDHFDHRLLTRLQAKGADYLGSVRAIGHADIKDAASMMRKA